VAATRPEWHEFAQFENGQAVGTYPKLCYHSELAWLNDLVATLATLESPAAVLSAVATIAGALLRANYPDLTEAELDSLLNVRPADPDLAAVVAAWDRLPAAVKAGIVAMVQAAAK
jgi:hypothetical protein